MIPVFKPILSGTEKKNLIECVNKKWFSSNGKFNFNLEKKFNSLTNRKYSSCVSNGTTALEIAVRSLGIKAGSEVIVPTFTIISPILALIRNKLKPVFVDIEKKYWSMSPSEIEKKINKNTKAILVVHTYGFPADMDKIMKIKKKYNLLLVEDAAEMHGQTYKNKPCGSFGEISTFSFYSNKFISCGEGGIVTTNSLKTKKKIDNLKNLSFGKKNRFEHNELGYNFRLSNLQAAVAYSQIKGLKKIIKRKREIGKAYNKFFETNNNLEILPFQNEYAKNIYWVYGIIVKKNNKKKLVKYLDSKKIETRDFFVGMHKQPILKKINLIDKKQKFPNSDYLEKNGIYIPSGPDISHEEIKYVANTINKFFSF
ncbi:DegT/DnrJ/EryC1/StrS family aminotransferase [Candidatus Pelagibacter sp. HIMB1748]|uniref:DegT/DnrJ/EryC1/StrS family aminotransferase n=1 Tax=unclassified Candidatus Pelagibacter TaxID=2647897 RepID=UPI003F84D1A6